MSRQVKSYLCFSKLVVKDEEKVIPPIFYANRGPWIKLQIKLEGQITNRPVFVQGDISPMSLRGEFLMKPEKVQLFHDKWTMIEINPRYFSHFNKKAVQIILRAVDDDGVVVEWVEPWKSQKLIVKSRKSKKRRRSMGGLFNDNNNNDNNEMLEFAQKCFIAMSSLELEKMIHCLETFPSLNIMNK